MIELNLKWQLANSKSETAKIKLNYEKKSIGLDTSIVIPYLLIKKCDWQNETIRNLKPLYNKQIETFYNIKNDIDTYLSYTNELNKDDIITNLKKIIDDNDYRQKANSYDNMLLSAYLSDGLKKIKDRAKSTIEQYRTNIKKIESYEIYYKEMNGKELIMRTIDDKFVQNFVIFLADEENYYKSVTVMRSIRGLFDVVLKENEKMINIINKSFTPIADPNENNNINDELPFELGIFEKMFDLRNLTEREEITRQWLIVACYSGLRVEDLLKKLNEKQIDKENNVISIIPKKTKKYNKVVYIPIWGHLADYFKLNDYRLPPKIKLKEFQQNLKLLYKKVDSTTTVDREKRVKTTLQNGKKAIRSLYNTYYVYDCFSPHDCRRFFVTTMLDNKLLTTDEIMIITGHKDLSTLLIYDKSNKKNIMIEKAKELQGQYITSI